MNTVINLHDVYDKVWFEETLLLLKNNFNMVTIEELESFYLENKTLKKSCHITVDDGDKTFYEVIYPLLKKHQIPASLFVSSKAIHEAENFWFQEIENFNQNKLKQTISEYFKYDPKTLHKYEASTILKNFGINEIWKIISTYKKENNIEEIKRFNITIEQLIEIDKDELVTIGAHTQNHPILANETNAQSQLEIEDSIDGLEQILGRKIKYFAYPNGIPQLDFGEREMDFLTKKGIKLSFTTKIDNFSKSNNPLAIPRIGISFGNKNFIRAKLFMGKYWQVLKKMKSTDEAAKRHSLKKKIGLL